MKKLFRIFLVLALAFLLVPNTAHAAGQTRIGFESKSAKSGETVELKLQLSDNEGISGLAISLDYDETVLTLSEVRKGNLFSGFTSGKNFVWDESENVTVDGTLATFVFTVADNAPAGDYTVDVIVRSCVNIDLEDVPCTPDSGVISIACAHDNKTVVAAKAADCENKGNNLYYICNDCGKVLKADGATETTEEAEALPAMGHDWAAATCTKPKTCSRCNKTEGAALGHDYVATVTAPTCTEKGFTTHTCSRCGDSKVDTYVDALGHTAGDWQYSDSEHWKVCVVDGCGAVLEDTRGNHVDADKDGKCDVCAYAVATQPEPTEPEPTQPEPTQPEPTQPEPTQPEPTQPEPTEPEPTQPEPTQPETTQPDPSLPETGDSENVLLWMALLLTSAMVAAAWVIGRKKSYRA